MIILITGTAHARMHTEKNGYHLTKDEPLLWQWYGTISASYLSLIFFKSPEIFIEHPQNQINFFLPPSPISLSSNQNSSLRSTSESVRQPMCLSLLGIGVAEITAPNFSYPLLPPQLLLAPYWWPCKPLNCGKQLTIDMVTRASRWLVRGKIEVAQIININSSCRCS